MNLTNRERGIESKSNNELFKIGNGVTIKVSKIQRKISHKIEKKSSKNLKFSSKTKKKSQRKKLRRTKNMSPMSHQHSEPVNYSKEIWKKSKLIFFKNIFKIHFYQKQNIR